MCSSGYLLDPLVVGGGLELVGGQVAQGAVQAGAVVLMRVIVSRGRLVEPLQEPVEDLLAADLALAFGVLALLLEGGAELDGGDEEGAALADGLEVAVHLDRAGAVAVAEHAPVHLAAEL